MGRLLEANRPGDGPGEATRFSARKQREEIERADLPFKPGAGWTGGDRGNGRRKVAGTILRWRARRTPRK